MAYSIDEFRVLSERYERDTQILRADLAIAAGAFKFVATEAEAAPEVLRSTSKEALRKLRAGDSSLTRMFVVYSWAVLEAFVRDLFVAWVDEFPDKLDYAELRRRFPKAPRKQPDESRKVFEKSIGTTPPLTKVLTLFQTVGLDIPIDQTVLPNIDDLVAVRHCFVHRGGIADERILKETETTDGISNKLRLVVGEPVLVPYTILGQWMLDCEAVYRAVRESLTTKLRSRLALAD